MWQLGNLVNNYYWEVWVRPKGKESQRKGKSEFLTQSYHWIKSFTLSDWLVEYNQPAPFGIFGTFSNSHLEDPTPTLGKQMHKTACTQLFSSLQAGFWLFGLFLGFSVLWPAKDNCHGQCYFPNVLRNEIHLKGSSVLYISFLRFSSMPEIMKTTELCCQYLGKDVRYSSTRSNLLLALETVEGASCKCCFFPTFLMLLLAGWSQKEASFDSNNSNMISGCLQTSQGVGGK